MAKKNKKRTKNSKFSLFLVLVAFILVFAGIIAISNLVSNTKTPTKPEAASISCNRFTNIHTCINNGCRWFYKFCYGSTRALIPTPTAFPQTHKTCDGKNMSCPAGQYCFITTTIGLPKGVCLRPGETQP